MSGKNADGAGVPGAEAAEVVEVGENEEIVSAGAEGDGDGEVVEENGEGEAELVVDDDETDEQDHKLTEKQQQAVNKRIGALTARRKEAEQERDALKAERDELAQRAATLGDAATVRVAETAGILPELVGKDEAQRIGAHAESKRSVEFFGDWLEDNTEPDSELELGGRKYSRAQVKTFKREHQRKLEELDDVPALTTKLRQQSAEILRLGMAARKAGWKPGQREEAATVVKPKPKLPVAPAPARTMPGGGKPRPGSGAPAKKSAEGIRDESDLALAIASGDFD